MQAPAAVLTGDLIGSTKAGAEAVDAALGALRQAAWVIGGWTGTDTHFTRFRGDGWQLLLTEPGQVLRAVLMLTAALRASGSRLATRIAVGLGTVDRLPPEDLSGAAGTAFVASGQALDRMHRTARLTLAGSGPHLAWQQAVLDLAERQIGQWSREQAEAVAMVLSRPGTSQADLAARLGITRQAFQARLAGSGLAAMTAALAAFEGGRHG